MPWWAMNQLRELWNIQPVAAPTEQFSPPYTVALV